MGRPETIDPLERRAMVRDVVSAVLSLEEPYRSTVLQRFYEGLSDREIAERLGIPLETVRTRIKRALVFLRGHLDGAHDGDRGKWLGALVLIGSGDHRAQVLGGSPLRYDAMPKEDSLLTKPAFVGLSAFVGVALLVSAWSYRRSGSGDPAANDPAGSRVSAATLREGEGPVSPGRMQPRVDGERELPTSDRPDEDVETLGKATLHVQVLDCFGEPALGVNARLVSAEYFHSQEFRPALQRMTSKTSREGTLTFEDVGPGEVAVVIDRMTLVHSYDVSAGETKRVTIALLAGVTVNGEVVDPEGLPVEGASIVMASLFRATDSGVVAARTGADGRFQIRSLSQNRMIGARALGFAPSSMIQVDAQEREQAVSIVLKLPGKSGEVQGQVVGASLEPLEGVEITLEFPQRKRGDSDEMGRFVMFPSPQRMTTGSDGRFRFGGVTPGKLMFFARDGNHAPYLTEIEVKPAEVTEPRVILGKGSTVSGRVLGADGASVAGVEVFVRDSATWRFRSPPVMTSGGDGGFSLERLAPGTLTIHIDGKSRHGKARREVRLTEGEELQWDAQLTSGREVRGVVVSEDATPLSNWLVKVWAPYTTIDPEIYRRYYELIENESSEVIADRVRADLETGVVRTDGDGRFSITNRLDSGHRLEIYDPARVAGPPSFRSFGVRPGFQEFRIVIPEEAKATARIEGRLVDATYHTIDLTRVSLASDDLTVQPVTAEVAEDRSFALGPVVAGKYALVVDSAVGPAELFRVVVGEVDLMPGQTLDLGAIRIEPPGSLRVVLRSEDDAQLVGVALCVVDAWNVFRLPCEFDGETVTREGLPPGNYTFCQGGFSNRGAIACAGYRFEIRSGEETTLGLTAEPGNLCRFEFFEENGPSSLLKPRRVRIYDETGEFVTQFREWYERRNLGLGLVLKPGRYSFEIGFDSGRSVTRRVRITSRHKPGELIRIRVD